MKIRMHQILTFTILVALVIVIAILLQPQPGVAVAQADRVEPLLPDVIEGTTYPIDPIYCIVDVDGANDFAGQKDLTRLCIDTVSDPEYIQVEWDWDELDTTQTMDAVTFFDSDGDGNVNYAVWVSVYKPFVLQAAQFAVCDDTSAINCEGPTNTVDLLPLNYCQVYYEEPYDPFPTGASYPNDSVGYCKIPLTMFALADQATVKVSNVCSLPSASINSVRSDCIAYEGGGFITIEKIASPDFDIWGFDFEILFGETVFDSTTIYGSGSQKFSVPANTYSVGEVNIPTGYTLSSTVCTEGEVTLPTTVFNPIGPVVVSSGSDVICTFTNTVPTSVTISDFDAYSVVSDIQVIWQTVSEVDVAGFNIYRTTNPDGSGLIQLNKDLIPATYIGQTLGTTYSYLDENVDIGVTYYYQLEVVTLSAEPEWIDPVSAIIYHKLYLPLAVKNQ